MKKDYYAKVFIPDLPNMLSRRRAEVAFWLRSLAREVETNHEAYSKNFTARYLKPIPREKKRGVN